MVRNAWPTSSATTNPAIIKEWTDFARTRSPASDGMSKLALEDHIADLLKFIADDLETAQTARQRVDKSHGFAVEDGPLRQSAAEIHAALRLADGFDIDQMVSEYRALRASIVKQWVARQESLASTAVEDLMRFNEAIDQAVTESVAHYTKTINNSRNLFLGVLGHDLRNPIGAASMAAQWMARSGTSDPKQAKLVAEMVRTTDRATRIIDDLLDLTRSSFGTDIPVKRSKTDLATLCQEIADELRGTNESQMIEVVSVHNFGPPIPSDRQKIIFQSWMRGQEVEVSAEHGTHLGLGLYIAKLIIEAHGGEIAVESEEKAGTTFTVRLPRG